jgi:hypothetical protein
MRSDDIIHPPWTPTQVRALNERQRCGIVHPFTCRRRTKSPHWYKWGDFGILVATVSGWVCRDCGYTQDWAYDFMFKGASPTRKHSGGSDE